MANPEPLSPPAIDQAQPLHILLVEDSLTNQKLIAKQIEGLGHLVTVVGDGESAVEAAGQSDYNIILMDCELPGIDGFEAAIAIRQQKRSIPTHPTVIIALTGSDLPEAQEQAALAGMNEYLTKPIRREMLAEVLSKWGALTRSMPQPTQPQAASANEQRPKPTHKLSLDLNWEHLHRLSDHNLEFESELLQIFVQDSTEQLGRLQQAIDRQDFKQLEESAHHLQGASGNMGAELMRQAAAQLEQQAQQRQLSSSILLLAQIEISLRQIQSYIKQDE
ncbi:MAG TPA: response regulator [Trichocoleus sp.]|jgi:CheY-like chemotaxis protein